jgi:hypothetical protein
MSFRMSRIAYTCSTVVFPAESPLSAEAVSIFLKYPGNLGSIENRVSSRTRVPETKKVRAMLWPGGLQLMPSEDAPDVPAWVGDVMDLSISGFCMNGPLSACMLLRQNDLIGLIVNFDDCSTIRGDGHIINIEQISANDTYYRIRFAALEDKDGQQPFQILNQKLIEYAAA